MYSALTRLNALFAFAITVLGALTFLCFLSTNFRDRQSDVMVIPSSPVAVELTLEHMASGPEQNDHAQLKFNLEANLSHLFDWNTKQLFVMLIAHYTTPKNEINQVVLWDKIILRGDSSVLDLKNIPTEYEFFDDGRGFLGNKAVRLELSWNVMPHAGLLPMIRSGLVAVPFPASYSASGSPRHRRM